MHLLFVFVLFISSCNAKLLLALPSLLRWNATNHIVVTPTREVGDSPLTDFTVELSIKNITGPIFRQSHYSQVAGSSFSVRLDIRGNDHISSNYDITVYNEKKDRVSATIGVASDIRFLFIQTDKTMYKPGEAVNIRALPLTTDGKLYGGEIDFSLMNPSGFELFVKRKKCEGRFIALSFDLPEHLEYGTWEVRARSTLLTRYVITSKQFEVRNYDLPVFTVFVSCSQTTVANELEVLIAARHAHGTSVTGDLRVMCESRDESRLSSVVTLTNDEIHDGYWARKLNITSCILPHSNYLMITAAVRDKGTGKEITQGADCGIYQSHFEIIPLRPGFSDSTKEILLVARSRIQSESEGETPLVTFHMRCVANDKVITSRSTHVEGNIGETVSIPVSNAEDCEVIQIEAYRKNDLQHSRAVRIVIPYFDESNGVDFSRIQIKSNNAYFTVGERVHLSVLMNGWSKINFLIVCNRESTQLAGRVRDDGQLSFTVSDEMIGQCILYVYSAEDGIHIDMMLFFVEPNCPYSVEVSSRTIEPSTNLTVTLRGGRNGLAFVHATDKRVASFQKISRIRFLSPHSSLSFFWDLSLFTKSLSTKDHFRLINFIDARKVRAGFMESCRTAGAIILKQFNECGKYETSPSAVSNECLRAMIQACNRAKVASLEVMPVCDSRSKDCSLTRMAELSSTRKFKGNLLSAEHTEENEKRGSDEDEQQKMLRQYFPEVWLFDDYAFGESDRKSLLLKAPDSVTEWQLNAAFWIPNDRTVCIPKENLITSRKQFFLDIQLPQHVYVNETVTAYATVTADELQSETSVRCS